MTLEESLEALVACGVHLAPGKSTQDLLAHHDREELEADPTLLLGALGEGLSPQLWHLDTECIDDDGSYIRIARRFAALAGGSLPIEKIRSHANFDAGEGWLELSTMGVEYRWALKVDGDWLDPAIVTQFARLLEMHGGGKRFTQLADFGGQDCLLGVATPAQLASLNALPGVHFVWLE